MRHILADVHLEDKQEYDKSCGEQREKDELI